MNQFVGEPGERVGQFKYYRFVVEAFKKNATLSLICTE